MKSTQKQTISTDKHSQPGAMVNAAWVAGVYLNRWGVPQDYGKAHKWFKKAADDGNTAAMINLGRLYEEGLGVAQDLRQGHSSGTKKPSAPGTGMPRFSWTG